MEHLFFKRYGARAAWWLALASSCALADPSTAGAERRVDINEYVVRGNTVLDARAIEEAVYPYLGPQKSLSDLEAAREALQQRYQALGYQSVFVELPEQKVEGGVVYLQVSETKVGRVRVVGAKHYSPVEIREQVPALSEGQVPDFTQVQAELAELNRTPNRQVMPLVREGQRPGTMDVDLQVEDQQPWRVSLGLNNDYSANTEKLRTVATVGYNNLWQLGHAISLTWFTAPEDKDNAEVWSGSYSAPLSERWSLQLSAFKSDSNVATVGGSNVLGKGHSYGIAAIYTVPSSGNWAHSLSAGIDFKDFDERMSFGGENDTVPIKYAPITLGYNGMRYTEASQWSLGLSVVAGTRSLFGYGSDDRAFDYKRYQADSSFLALRGDTSFTFNLIGNWQSASKLGFQLASGPLVSNEQFAAGGATSVRGYLAAERTGDDGVLFSQELRTPSIGPYLSSAINDWRFYLFTEGAHLTLKDPLPDQHDRFDLLSVGIGTRATLNDWLSGSLDWGLPLKDGPNTEKNDSRLHFSVQATF